MNNSVLACGCSSACPNITTLNQTFFIYTPSSLVNSRKKFDFITLVNCSSYNTLQLTSTQPLNCTTGSDVVQIIREIDPIDRVFSPLDSDCSTGLIPNKTTYLALRRLYHSSVNVSISCFNTTSTPRRELLCGVCNCNPLCDWIVGVVVGGLVAICALLFAIWAICPGYCMRTICGIPKKKKVYIVDNKKKKKQQLEKSI